MGSGSFLWRTDYKATLADAARIKITHPFLDFTGKEFIVVTQYIRNEQLYLQCTDDAGCRVISIPASYTDYAKEQSNYERVTSVKNSHFTVAALSEAETILNNALKMSTN